MCVVFSSALNHNNYAAYTHRFYGWKEISKSDRWENALLTTSHQMVGEKKESETSANKRFALTQCSFIKWYFTGLTEINLKSPFISEWRRRCFMFQITRKKNKNKMKNKYKWKFITEVRMWNGNKCKILQLAKIVLSGDFFFKREKNFYGNTHPSFFEVKREKTHCTCSPPKKHLPFKRIIKQMIWI